ncbi:MAG: O-antigen ligase family protein [Planctomycetales bacterium]|nr:O-antigen ligase family protein [Planctomycetales bacterium]MBN8626100.1 O-antigen ligase family protein [Planctomycetota bacterium]
MATLAVAPEAGRSLRNAAVPLLLLVAGCLLGLWQLTPWAAAASPEAMQLREQFVAAETYDDAPRPVLSLHPPTTRQTLALLVMATASFALGAVFFGDPRSLLWLLGVLAVVGAAVSAMGLIDRLTPAPWHYAGIDAPVGTKPFGPFINRNSAAGFLCISLAAALGLSLWRWRKLANRTRPDRLRGLSNWTSVALDPGFLLLMTTAIFIFAGIAGTMSRGGLLAAIVGSLCAAMLFGAVMRTSALFWPVAGIGAAAAVMVVWLGLGSNVAGRWELLADEGWKHENRFALWHEAVGVAKVYGLFGSGLGTFYFAHAPFQRHHSFGSYQYAENQFVEAAVVGGYIGLSIMLLFGLRCLAGVRQMLRNAVSSAEFGAAFASACLLLMQFLCACFDFSWFLPSLFVPISLWCGAIANMSAESCRWRTKLVRRGTRRQPASGNQVETATNLTADSAEYSSTSPSPSPPDHVLSAASPSSARLALPAVAAIVVCVAALAWGFWETRLAAVAEKAERVSRPLLRSGAKPSAKELDDAIELVKSARAACRDDSLVRTRLAELLAKRYELETGRSTFAIYTEVALALRIGNSQAVTELRAQEAAEAFLKPAWDESRIACGLCPLNYYAHLMAAQLSDLYASTDSRDRHLECVERLAQGRSDWLRLLGAMRFDAAQFDMAWKDWRRACQLSGGITYEVFPLALSYLGPDAAMKSVVPDDPEIMLWMAMGPLNGYSREAQDKYLQKVIELTENDQRSSRNKYLRGVALLQLGRYAAAESLIEDALRAADFRRDWYFDLAVALAALGRKDAGDVAYKRYEQLIGPGAKTFADYRSRTASVLERKPDPTGVELACAGDYYAAAGQPDAAVAVYLRAIAQSRENVAAYAGLIKIYLGKHDLAQAEATLKEASQLHRDNSEIGTLWLRLDERKKGVVP